MGTRQRSHHPHTMTRVRRSRTRGSAKSQLKDFKTKRYKKDTDQVYEELERQRQGLPKLRTGDTTIQEAEAEELPGGGEFPCVHCSRHFISKPALDTHLKTKIHKRRLKELKDKPYSQEEADAAAGLGRETRRRPADAHATTEMEMSSSAAAAAPMEEEVVA